MANVNVPYPETGLASFEVLDSHFQKFLLSGSDPKLEPGFPLEVATGVAFQQFHVVGLNASNKLVIATWNATPASAIKPIGVITQALASQGSAGVKVPVFYTGCFDPAALVWDASFDTDAKKAEAFMGSPSPTRVVIRKRL